MTEHTELEMVDAATSWLAEAKRRLDPDHRHKLKLASYQQSLTDLECLEKGLKDAEHALEVFEKYREFEIEWARRVIKAVKKEIDKLTPKPKKIEMKPKPLPVVTTPKIGRRVKKRGSRGSD